jgi:hypothetical protein
MTHVTTSKQAAPSCAVTTARIAISPSTDEALVSLAGRLCAADNAELKAVGLPSPLLALRQSAAASREAYVASWDGKVQGAFGVADCPDGSMRGIPWMLSTGHFGPVRKEFHAESRRMLREWAPMYCGLFNIVSVDHTDARRWLRSLGFAESAPLSFQGQAFVAFGASTNV